MPRYLSEGEAKRLEMCRNMIAARTKPDGTPKPGFTRNVAVIQREIAEIEARGEPQPVKLKNA